MPKGQGHDHEIRSERSEWQRIGAEFLGTADLTFVAAGADIVDFVTGAEIGHVARYVAPTLVVSAMIWTLSGAAVSSTGRRR